MNKKILISLIVLLVAVCGVSTYFHIKDRIESEENKKMYETVAEEVSATEDSTVVSASEATVNPYTEYTGGDRGNSNTQSYPETMTFADNPDMVGWIKIDGTNINYSVMQTPNEPDYYLDRDFYKNQSVFAVPVEETDKKSFKYYEFVNAYDPQHFSDFVSKCKEHSFYDTGVTAKYGDKLLTLSTCEYTHDNGRLVVVAKRRK